MRRIHLFEFEDQAWFPAAIRNGGTDLLRFMLNLTDGYGAAAPLLAQALRDSRATHVVDLCSGGGGPWRRMLASLTDLGVTEAVILTDRFPNPEALADFAPADRQSRRISYHPEPVDVLGQIPAKLDGFRTLFSAFHHFPPELAAQILRNAVRDGAPIGIFEATRREWPSILATLLISPWFNLIVAPLIKPFRWSRMFFTYIIPAIPLLILWDGVISCLRSYTVAEMRAIIATIPEAAQYEWRVGEAKGNSPMAVTYLIGLPRR